MRVVRTLLTAALLVSSAIAGAACSSGTAATSSGGGSPDAGAPATGGWNDGDPVSGNWSVSWKNLDPKYPANAISVVNASSEIGAKLLSGRATSTEIRVATDAQMGALVSELRRLGFFENATEGMSLENAPNIQGAKGIVVVMQEGRAKGLFMRLGLGKSAVPESYTNCKRIVVAAHMQLTGLDARAGLGAPDENVFSAPKPTFRRP